MSPLPCRTFALLLMLCGVSSAQPLSAQPLSAQEELQDPARVIGQAVERQLLLEVESRLQSDDLSTVAWGAWLAARHRVKSAVPALRKRLQSMVDVASKQRRFTVNALLDALRCNDASLRTDELSPFVTGLHEPLAFVLASRNAKQHRDFLWTSYVKSDKSRRHSRWLASGNLLASISDRTFARRLVRSLKYRLEIRAHDDDPQGGGGVGGAFGGRFGDGRVTVPEGYPPLAMYHLVTRPKAGDVLLTAARKPVYWRRIVHEQRKIGFGAAETIPSGSRQTTRVLWLREMLEFRWLELAPVVTEWVEFKDEKTFREQIGKLKKRIVNEHDKLLRKAVAKAWFEADDLPQLQAKVVVAVRDIRGKKHVPLPEIK